MGNLPQFSSPARPEMGNLHKRRASVSPQKFNTGQFEPLTVRTDLPILRHESPPKRTRTTNKLEVTYDAAGTPRLHESPANASAGFNPGTAATTAGFITSAKLSSALGPPTSKLSALPTNSRAHLLRKDTPRFSPKPWVKQKGFSLLEAFVKDNALCLELVSYLPIPSLIDLYAISKTFHWTFNKHAASYIMSSMRTWAPKADQLYPWRCYLSLCMKDPIVRQKFKVKNFPKDADIDALGEFSRDVPSIRWLQMVVWREGVVNDMMIQLACRGLMLPGTARDAVKRMWFILDLPLNAHRQALMRNPNYISDKTLHRMLVFLVKVDMAFTNPADEGFSFNLPNVPPNHPLNQFTTVGCTLRKFLLEEPSLTPLWRVLHGWNWDPQNVPPRNLTEKDIQRLWTRHRAFHDPRTTTYEVQETPVHGMKLYDIPLVGYERIYRLQSDPKLPHKARLYAQLHPDPNQSQAKKLLRPDELVIGEIYRRELKSKGSDWNFLQIVGSFFMKKAKNGVALPTPVMSEKELLLFEDLMKAGKRPTLAQVRGRVKAEENKEMQVIKEYAERRKKGIEEHWEAMVKDLEEKVRVEGKEGKSVLDREIDWDAEMENFRGNIEAMGVRDGDAMDET